MYKKQKTGLSCAFAQTVGIHSHAPCGESTSVSHMTFLAVLYPVQSGLVNESCHFLQVTCFCDKILYKDYAHYN